jgi:hypothetical protein
VKPFVPTKVAMLAFWCCAFAALWPRAVAAQELLTAATSAASLAHDIHTFDLESLAWAVVMSLMGGGLRTIFTLATDATVVVSFGREMLKDAVVAMIAGALAYIVVEAFGAFKVMPVAPEVRFAIIVFAGWSRLSFFGWLNRLGTQVTESVGAKIQGAISTATATDPSDPASPGAGTPAPTAKPKPFQEQTP